eukprot:4144265-Amphidinium_carterae.1
MNDFVRNCREKTHPQKPGVVGQRGHTKDGLTIGRRDNVEGLVDYLNNPTTYDGLVDISEVHPSMKAAKVSHRNPSITLPEKRLQFRAKTI